MPTYTESFYYEILLWVNRLKDSDVHFNNDNACQLYIGFKNFGKISLLSQLSFYLKKGNKDEIPQRLIIADIQQLFKLASS